ncbi:HNH endonuclease [Colwellia sp. BRX8-9]|uniref:HNH endonuclease n=1 Tax=Colwellia sp. BRX8-9 TaxID=2759831 RepID=UPI0015F69332|nr:HNH endonuclease [Colwellia sp. BRX8-9]MBA6348310.1 HNH endonuclease [Colwellia sp. BRX8-9]
MEALFKHQIDFISYLQRLLQEGDFSSTYKFAFLHAIADICIEKNIQNSERLTIPFDEIVDKLILLYWQHAKPFSTDTIAKVDGGILLQNAGKQARIISDITSLQLDGIKNLSQAKNSPLWKSIYKNTLKTLKEGPLWRLQVLSQQEDCFFFPHKKGKNFIELNEGVAGCFRQFHDLVVQFTRQGWIEKISKIQDNQTVVGRAGELNDFLFGTNRSSIVQAVAVLQEIQQGECFYCNKPIKGTPEVDHFIPFAKYGNDLGHNFVLAHKSCNNSKRDYLAALPHRDNWINQNLVNHEATIKNELSSYFSCDSERTSYVADWAYQIAKKSGSRLWLSKDSFI